MANIHNETPRPVADPEGPEDLKLTEDEQARVELLSETMSRQQALERTVSRSKAERIIGYEESSRILKGLAEQPDRPEPEGPSTDELVALLRGTNPAAEPESDKPTTKEA